ncbi:hypothetical protein Plhal304r1_c028g0093861 [Plasmopara halstedii]
MVAIHSKDIKVRSKVGTLMTTKLQRGENYFVAAFAVDASNNIGFCVPYAFSDLVTLRTNYCCLHYIQIKDLR